MAKLPDDKTIASSFARLGNKAAVAAELGIDRGTVRKRLALLGISHAKPHADGRRDYIKPVVYDLPEEGEVKRYIVTSIQNNTKVHVKFLRNLETYCNFVDAELIALAFSYNKTAYSHARSLVPGRGPNDDDRAGLWYASEVLPYIKNMGDSDTRRLQLAPDLFVCGELDISPTASDPLSDLDAHPAGGDSAIVPHTRLQLKSVATMKGNEPKMLYTTGTCGYRNYIQRKLGTKAEFHHAFAALIVEVDADGEWWVRQLNATADGSFQDCPEGADGVVSVRDGEVYSGGSVEAVSFGDVHASEIDEDVAKINWSKDGYGGDLSVVDALRPKYQVLHDLFSMRSRSHHDAKEPAKVLLKHHMGVTHDSVKEEVKQTAALMREMARPFSQLVVVNSNHDRHGDRWLDEAVWHKDPLNAEFMLEALLSRAKAIREAAEEAKRTGRKDPDVRWQFHEWALTFIGCPDAKFLRRDESFRVKGIECGMHGDEGPNGSRGTTRSYRHMDTRVNKGHDHVAAIVDGVYSAGACARSFSYMHGPSAHSVSHILIYPNGKRQIVTVRGGKWRAVKTE